MNFALLTIWGKESDMVKRILMTSEDLLEITVTLIPLYVN